MRQLVRYFFFIYSIYGYMQNETHNKFIHISNADGLSQSSVIAIEQDHLQQMWIGTRDGLNKYDGHTFTVYKNDPNNPNSLSNNDILCIKEDTDKNIWIGTYNGLNRYDPQSNTFTSYFHSAKKGDITDNTIWKITVVNKNELWIGTSNGLMVYNREEDTFTAIKNIPSDSNSLSNNRVLDIFQDHTNDIWIATANGLNKLISTNANTYSFKRYTSENTDLKDSHIQSIVEDTKGIVWVGTKSGGLHKSTPAKDNFSPIVTTSDQKIINVDIRSLAVDQDGNIWIATYDGLYLKNKEDQIFQIKHQQGNPKSLSRNTLKTIFIDNKGSVWIGAYYGGINIWDRSNSNFITLYKKNNNNDIEYGVVSSMVQSKNGSIYFGTEGKGISIIKPNNVTSNLDVPVGKKLPSSNIKSLFLDGDKLWIGTYNAGVIVYDLVKKDFDTQIISSELQLLIQKQGVYAITKLENNILLGTFGNGLISYNPVSKEVSSTKNTLSDRRIRAITIDNKENIWIGTQNGLNFISKTTVFQSAENFSAKRFLFNKEQLSGDDILCISETRNHTILVGTKSNGIYEYDGNNFKKLELHIPNTTISTVYGIVEDNNQAIWLSTNKGIVKHHLQQQKSILYDQAEGLTTNEFNSNSCLKKFDGTLLFGGPEGVSYLNPNNLQPNDYIPPIIFTKLKIQGKEIKEYSRNSVLEKHISYTKNLTLDYKQKSFTIYFALPSYINAANNHFQYRLVGLDNEWQYTKNTEINYTIQKPGTYQFQIKGANSDDKWTEEPSLLNIKIQAAPWRTVWAFTGYGLIIILAFLGVIRILKIRTKLKHELALEHLESTRIKELNRSKLEFFTNISHEFRTPLALIIGPLQQIIENYQGSNKMFKKLLGIERNADQLLALINQLLDFRKFENKHYKLQVAEGNLVKFLKEIYLSFREYADIGNYKYAFESDIDEIRVYFDRYKLERVFYNLISNAFKYTPKGGNIQLKIFEKDNQVVIEVRDNGKGIDTEFIHKVFDRFYEVSGAKEYQKHFNQASGIGLSIAKKAINLHQGTIDVQSEPNQGSVFSVQLKKGTAHLDKDTIIQDFKISDDISQYKSQIPSDSPDLLELDVSSKDDKKHTILIAEDNNELRKFIKDILKTKYQVEEAENGEKAFKKVLQKSPDLIISDVIMPKMEGTELCAKVKNDIRTSHIPIILLTSRTSLIYKFNGLESGADAYINKPFNVKEFLLTVKNILESSDKIKEKFSSDNNFGSDDYTVTSIDEQLFKKAIKIVEDNIDNISFDIPFFSSELGVSRTMLFTKIKGWTNLTPNEFIHSIRMKRAAQLLEIGEINISEACYKVGFRNPKYFTKCFKKHYQLTPSEYASKFY